MKIAVIRNTQYAVRNAGQKYAIRKMLKIRKKQNTLRMAYLSLMHGESSSCFVPPTCSETEADDWRRPGVFLGAAGWAAGGALAEMNVYSGADGCTVLSFALSRRMQNCSFDL